MITKFSHPAPAPTPEEAKTLRILVVEDNKNTLRSLKLLLTSLHYDVTTAQTLHEAVDLARERQFDLLLSDIGLPDGNGFDLLSAIRERQSIHGIAVTGHGDDEDVRKSHEVGFLHHLVKPVSVDLLQAAIHEAQTHHE